MLGDWLRLVCLGLRTLIHQILQNGSESIFDTIAGNLNGIELLTDTPQVHNVEGLAKDLLVPSLLQLHLSPLDVENGFRGIDVPDRSSHGNVLGVLFDEEVKMRCLRVGDELLNGSLVTLLVEDLAMRLFGVVEEKGRSAQ